MSDVIVRLLQLPIAFFYGTQSCFPIIPASDIQSADRVCLRQAANSSLAGAIGELPEFTLEVVMHQCFRRAAAAVFGLVLMISISSQASAQEDPMQDVTLDEPSAQASVADGYGKGCCDDACCGSGSFYGEFQYLRLQAYSSEGDAFSFSDEQPDPDNGYRINLGYEGCNGVGVRVRWFDYDGVQDIDGDDGGLDLDYFDIEVTEAICICNLQGVISAGYRHGNYAEYLENFAVVDFEGDGVTFGALLQHDLTCHVGLYGWVQHSLLFGDYDSTFDFGEGEGGGIETFSAEGIVMGWTEAQFGAQYSTCVGGYNAFVRGGVEAQHHVGIADDNSENTGLLGWFVSGGVNF